MSKTSDFNIIELEFAKIPFLQKYEGPGGEVAIPEGVVQISSLAFSSNQNIISIEIPSTVTEIQDWTFYLQYALKKVSIPDSVEEMGVHAFEECKALTEVIVSDKFIEKMWRYCHADLKYGICCTYLRSVENFSEESAKRLTAFIKKNKKAVFERICVDDDVAVMQSFLALEKKITPLQIDEYISAAEGYTALTAYLLDFKSEHFSKEQVDAALQEETDKQLGIKQLSVADWRKLFKFKIENGQAIISGYKGEADEISIPGKIGDNTVIIGERAFDNKRLLKKVTIKAGVKEIRAHAFFACVNVTEIHIEEGLTKIGFAAFESCQNLCKVIIPSSVQEMKDYVFIGDKDLTIHAPAGSYAEQYAKENNIPFVAE